MNHIDLEMYRWKFHHDIYLPSIHTSVHKYSWSQWWQEHAAFISTLPRQSGKTTMLKKLITYFEVHKEDFLVIVPSTAYIKYFINKTGVSAQYIQDSVHFQNLASKPFNHINLLVDEYQNTHDLKNVLHNSWKTVTMVGTLRL